MKVDHALISNMSGAALIGSNLGVDWLALPRFDSPPLFMRLLDSERGGYMEIRFNDEVKSISRGYLNDLPILKSTVILSGGSSVTIIDLMPIGIPAFVRHIEINGYVDYELVVKPMFNYGLVEPYIEELSGGFLFINPLGNDVLELIIKNTSCKREGFSFKCSGPGDFVLHYPIDKRVSVLYNKDIKMVSYNYFNNILKSTIRFWSNTVKPITRYGDVLEKVYNASIIVLTSLIYKLTGGIVSSPTTSLPEIIGEGRNWDYRFVWVRDASIASVALLRAGYPRLARAILSFMVNIADLLGKPFDYSVYAVDGTYPFDERELRWLSGYMGSRPVRIGNAASTQLQLDLEGWFLDALHEYVSTTKDTDLLDYSWPVVETAADWCSKNYMLKDAGLWEQRDAYRHYTHSKVMMWVCLDRAAKLAIIRGYKELGDEWSKRAEEIRSYVLSNQPDEFTMSFENKEPDASLLVLPIYGFIDIHDRRFLNTLNRIEKELVINGWVYRYTKDFLGTAKHPFILTTEWLGMVYSLMGLREKAQEILLKIAKCANDLGLLGEHMDITTCEPRGNYPHVFSHAGYILLYKLLNNPDTY